MKRIRYILIVVNTIICLTVYNQNLVLNPSFETVLGKNYPCPTLLILTYVSDWNQPTEGSVDYFQNDVFCDRNSNNIKAHGGKSFIGEYYIESNSRKRYREYFQGKLIQPLKKNKKYLVEFYIRLSPKFSTAVSGVGAYINDELIERKGTWRLHLEPQIVCDTIITEKNKWVKVSGVYVAQGDEKYITIGNFMKFWSLKKKQTTTTTSLMSYYFIDDVSVIEIPEEIDTAITDSVSFIKKDPLPIIPKLEETRVLENIQFPTNKWDIDTSSYKTLNKLYNYLMMNPFVKIQVNGYTDNRGRDDFNLGLSEKRAKAVVDYLISKGISETRLNYKGYGVANPIGDNATEEGRSKNRRIEIEIKENGADVLNKP